MAAPSVHFFFHPNSLYTVILNSQYKFIYSIFFRILRHLVISLLLVLYSQPYHRIFSTLCFILSISMIEIQSKNVYVHTLVFHYLFFVKDVHRMIEMTKYYLDIYCIRIFSSSIIIIILTLTMSTITTIFQLQSLNR